MTVAVVGSLSYERMEAVEAYVAALAEGSTLVVGAQYGVERTARRAALKNGMRVLIFPANWDRYGPAAAAIRRLRMLQACDHLAAFWDGKGVGPVEAVNMAQRMGKSYEIWQ